MFCGLFVVQKEVLDAGNHTQRKLLNEGKYFAFTSRRSSVQLSDKGYFLLTAP